MDIIVGIFQTVTSILTLNWGGFVDRICNISRGVVSVVSGVVKTILSIFSPVVDLFTWVGEKLGLIDEKTDSKNRDTFGGLHMNQIERIKRMSGMLKTAQEACIELDAAMTKLAEAQTCLLLREQKFYSALRNLCKVLPEIVCS